MPTCYTTMAFRRLEELDLKLSGPGVLPNSKLTLNSEPGLLGLVFIYESKEALRRAYPDVPESKIYAFEYTTPDAPDGAQREEADEQD
jgi:hypothetical protein